MPDFALPKKLKIKPKRPLGRLHGAGRHVLMRQAKRGGYMETLLKATELAQIMGCSERYVQKLGATGKLCSRKILNEKNRPMMFFPLSELSPELQRKYLAQNHIAVPQTDMPGTPEQQTMDSFSADEREEIQFWLDTLSEWQQYRENYTKGSKAQADEQYVCLCAKAHPEKLFSTDILYRKQRALRNKNLSGLLDKRGKSRKGKSSIPEVIWQAFLSFYLDEAQHPIKKCWEYTKMWAQQERPELVADIPCYTTFSRHVKSDVLEAVKTLGREGEKAFSDRCAPYIRRTYEDMQSNDWWIADNHTFDIISQDENGKNHRLYLTAFFDARGGIFTGCYVTLNPSSQATLIALRKGIIKYGIPKNIYVDNGREFLTFDIGGLGHRQKKNKGGKQYNPPPVFTRLGIKMTNAIVRNAKAKIIERRFRDVKDHLSRLFETYTGGNVVERPERLKKVLKKGGIATDAELTAIVEELLEHYFNEAPYGGAVAADRGKPRMQVYQENLLEKRTTSAEELALMLMRSARPQKITNRGVHLDIGGGRIDYWNNELLALQDQTVYFRYDPENLAEVRVYDLEDRYIMSVPADNEAILSYNASKEEVKAAMNKTRRFAKITKEVLQSSVLPGINSRTALELVLSEAERNKQARAENPLPEPKIIALQRPNEEPLLKAIGDDYTPDLSRMTRNAKLRNGGNEDGENI